jgi:H+/Cl- antiporter ClcA
MSLFQPILRSALATGAAFVALMLIEVAWHDAFFSGYYESIPYVVRENPQFTAPAVAAAIRALLMTLLYATMRRPGAVVVPGFTFGAVIGGLTGIYWVPSYYAQQPIPELVPWAVIDGTFFLVQGAAAGLVIAVVLGKGRPADRAA